MQKLIELLNEYEKTLEPNLQVRWTVLWIEATPELIVGKKFWFIQWLVENDKISLEKVYNNFDYPMVKRNEFLYEWLLMLLSISDTPIDDLISYLK